jgi:hypothetical protein
MRSKLVLTFLAGLAVGLVLLAVAGRQRVVQARQLEEEARRKEKAQRATINDDPLDKLLADMAAATAMFDVEKAEQLFLPPDDTPAGKNRQGHLAEIRKDWKRAKEAGAKAGPRLQFKNTKKVIRTQLAVGDGAKQQTSEVEITVAFTDQSWKIVSLETNRGK